MLVAETTTFSLQAHTEIIDGHIWVHGVPSDFMVQGLGYGTRLKYKGFAAFITRFLNARTAEVTICIQSREVPEFPVEAVPLPIILELLARTVATAES